MKITIVTGNPGKVRDLQMLADKRFDLSMHDLDLVEIQSLNLEDIVKDKARKAYAILHKPVVVDDVSAGLASLNGLPGPFIKYFNERLGEDALYKLAQSKEDKVTVTCMAAYYDGKRFIIGQGIIEGTVISPRGSNGFGFDSVIVPEGESITMAEMSPEQKAKISHRGKAFRSLMTKLADQVK